MTETGNRPRWTERLVVFGNAVERLTVVVDLSRQRTLDEFERDSLIKRFEFNFILCYWNCTRK